VVALTRYASLFTFVYLIIATAIAHHYWDAQSQLDSPLSKTQGGLSALETPN
jgi:uncharacterized membrane protein YphA (DoxX/SURF4 family)